VEWWRKVVGLHRRSEVVCNLGRCLSKNAAVQSAKAILLDVVDRYSKAARLHYGLPCWQCLLGDIEVAGP